MSSQRIRGRRLAQLVCGAVTMFSVGASHADPLQWTFQNVVFDDGATAMGSFVFDADTAMYSNWNITTGLGTLAGYNYNSSSGSGAGIDVFVSFLTPAPVVGLDLLFQAPLSNGGGTIFLEPGVSMEYETFGPGARAITGGSVTTMAAAVPEPSTYALMLAGLGFIAFVAHRKRLRESKLA